MLIYHLHFLYIFILYIYICIYILFKYVKYNLYIPYGNNALEAPLNNITKTNVDMVQQKQRYKNLMDTLINEPT